MDVEDITWDCMQKYIVNDDLTLFSLIQNKTKTSLIYKCILNYNISNGNGINIFKYLLDNYLFELIGTIYKEYFSIHALLNNDIVFNEQLRNMKLDIVIKKLADDTIKNECGNTPFSLILDRHGGINLYKPDLIKKIINTNPKLISIKNVSGKTPFHLIMQARWVNLGYYCLKKGANIFDLDNEGKSAFCFINIYQIYSFESMYYIKKIQEFVITQYTETYIKQLCCCRSLSEDNLLHNNYLPRDMFNLIIKSIETERRTIAIKIMEKYHPKAFTKMKIIKAVFRNHEGFKKLPAEAVDKLMMHVFGWEH